MRYEFWIDRGGTFTDCILFDHQTGEQKVTKILSSDDSPLLGIRKLLGLSESEAIPPSQIRMGTTVATNALLERTGAATALVITRGFADLLRIGDQTRPLLFGLAIKKPEPLCSSVHEISARLSPDGACLEAPTDEELRALAKQLASRGVQSIALVVLHSYANPQFERSLGENLLSFWPQGKMPPPVTLSSEASPEQGLLGRGSTAVLDAYITPLLKQYLKRLSTELEGSTLWLMQSSGGLASQGRFRGPEAILSGPAGGVIAGERIARLARSKRLVTFDMGGTSTDVALIEGTPNMRFEKSISGIPLRARMLDIHTIAAGGGSECSFNGYSLVVGPQSLGADPGPLCYGRAKNSHRLALTDINLALGRLASDHFPFELDAEASLNALSQLAAIVSNATMKPMSAEELALGFASIATTNMAEAIRMVTLERGLDVRTVDLLVFGGAAGQHACAIASTLGIKKILVHRLSGVLSAHGIGQAENSWSGESDAGRFLLSETNATHLESELIALEQAGLTALNAELGGRPSRSRPLTAYSLAVRYKGQESTLDVPWTSVEETRVAFTTEHNRRLGYSRPEADIEVVSCRVELRLPRDTQPVRRPSATGQATSKTPARHTRVVLDSGVHDSVPVYELTQLEGCPPVLGPALLLDPTGTYLLERGYQAALEGDLLTMTWMAGAPRGAHAQDLEGVAATTIMATRFAAIAEQMGERLRRSASSTNIKERLDYSCAVFDARGHLVANAPHIPVHLGAMSESVAAVLRRFPKMEPGDAFVTNDPALGGSHLPDITVVTPVFNSEGLLKAFTASRGHHADVGGIEPGSMPAFSRSLEEEGVVLSALRFVAHGRILESELMAALGAGPYPTRNPRENLADLEAQLAANHLGARLLMDLEEELPGARLAEAMDTVRALSARWMRDALKELGDEPLTFSDQLDDGSRIEVCITKDPGGVHVDFSGSSAESSGNFNAPRAVTVACVLYVLRTLLNRPLPLNQGCLDPVRLTIPTPSLLSPSVGRAVAAGNVETSQRIVDVLLGALGLAAASQGTMNNLSFGTSEFGYYETIAGGAGAGPGFAGASAVHTHMTNTRITDPEVLEERFPVRVHTFSVRKKSGGAGHFPGGDGIVRELEALKPLRLSLLTQRRTTAPFGLSGGHDGLPGVNHVAGAVVGPCFSGELKVGERVRVETPGGGGFGPPRGPSKA